MDNRKIILLFNTVKYLKFIQIYYRIYYFFRNRFFNRSYTKKINNSFKPIKWKNFIVNNQSYSEANQSFDFLNITKSFARKIDWNYHNNGKLWTYNLNYFDYLNQLNLTKESGLNLIKDYLINDSFLKDGKEPYPISLRGINWIKFLSSNQVNDTDVSQKLYNDYQILLNNLEYHLLGNHLLENGFSLLFGAYYFQDETIYKIAKKIVVSELEVQILADGSHFELSPMYHQILFHRVLDCIQLIKLNTFWKDDELLCFLSKKASLMHTWLKNITYRNGTIPMVNDATYNIAPQSTLLFDFAKHLEIEILDLSLSESGYRKITNENYELFIDVGNVGPDYQPGHAHSDTFNFELIKNGNPIFVDTGISTYEKNDIRQYERATHSHNTVKIGDKEQTQVWGGFRVAKRAKITHLIEKPNLIEASHDGYLSDGYKHTRSFLWGEKYLILKDKINRSTSNKAKAYFHLHFSVSKPLVDGNNVIIESSGVSIEFERASNICIEEYQLSVGFNKTNLAYKIVVLFDQTLKTKISL